jgi:hypothetical protein
VPEIFGTQNSGIPKVSGCRVMDRKLGCIRISPYHRFLWRSYDRPDGEAFFRADMIFSSPTVAGISASLSDTFRARIPGIIPEKPGIIHTFHPFLRRKNKETNSINWAADLFQNGLRDVGRERTPVLAQRSPFSTDGHRRGFQGWRRQTTLVGGLVLPVGAGLSPICSFFYPSTETFIHPAGKTS